MAEQTLVAVYDTPAHADAAVRALEAAGVPSDAVSRHAQAGTTVGNAGGTTTRPREKGFWASLFGGDTDDEAVYDRSVAGGATVVTVRAPEQYAARVHQILEAHDPVDLDERAASYGIASTAATTAATTTTTSTTATATGATVPAAAAPLAAVPPVAATARTTAAPAATDETIKVVEERLTVGKRAVNRGGARIRSYVVETPVEEQVVLRDETVRVERRPVDRPVGSLPPDAFQDKVIEVREVDEEAVVSKQARIVEEIALRKEATERVETVRDTVRRTEVDIEDTTGTTGTGMTGTTRAAGTTTTTGTSTTGTTGTGTGVGASVDRTLGTNMTGANPGADAPDGTPGNPPGTMASRAVDKTLGTNISGANPDRKS